MSAPANIRPRDEPLQGQCDKFTADALYRGVFLAVPGGNRVAHAEDRQRGKARVRVGAKLALADALADHRFEDRLDGAGKLADPPPARVRQELALREEHAHEMAAVEQRRDMSADQACQLLARRPRSGRDRLLGLEEARDALHADMLEGDFLRGAIVVKASLSN